MSATQMPWVKLYTEMLDDPKVSELDPYQFQVFVQLVLFAGECDMDGLIGDATGPFVLAKVAWRLRHRESNLRHAVSRLMSLGLIEERDGGLWIPKFSARQGRPQAEQRQMWRDQQRKHRAEPDSVMHDSSLSPRSRGEESRGEKKRDSAAPRRLPPTPPSEYPSAQVFREITHRWPAKSLQPELHAAIGSEPEAVELWRKVVRAWIGLGWNPMNLDGMLECFKRGEVPRLGRPGESGPAKLTDKEYGERLRAGTLPVEPEVFIPPSMRA
jgi:hypothetical protein